ncbi:MAG: SHOCT domain-containing protein [Anaerolineae bacterium]|nr:SHOCT domain-containing protein [Anaerolineae bacterium]MCO5203633.1 SHOCT domain-containing protein [Anaerolineae bacterium]
MRRRGMGPGRMAARRATVRMASRRRRRRRRRRVILVGGLVALGAYKLSKHDVERVEQHTGKSAEELSDEELEQAMSDLNISADEMTDEEYAQVEQADEQDYIEELQRLAELHDQGILTDEEFAAKKAQLLDLE